MRIFAVFVLLLAPLCAQDVQKLTILHTNDLHAHLVPNEQGQGGLAYLATAVREQRAGCTACLFLNAGDLVQGTPVSTIYQGVPVYQIANLLGIDVSTPGNHEFDYGWKKVQEFVSTAKFPLVSANVADDQGTLLTGQGYAIKTVGKIRVAVIGVVLGDLVGNFATKEQVGPWRVIPVVEAVRKTIPLVRDRADLIVVLGHIHDEETEAILREVPEVSVVVAGHDHRGYGALKQMDGRVAVELRGYGVELGRLDLDVDVPHKKVVSSGWKRIPIDSHKLAPAADVAKLVAEWESKVAGIVDVPIGESKRKLAGNELRALIERAMAERTGADFAWVNRGNVRDILPQGKLLARSIWNILPFDNRIVIGRFKGSQLPPAITKEHPVEPDKEYAVATTDFTAANQASADELNMSGLQFNEVGPLQRDAVIDWIKHRKVVE